MCASGDIGFLCANELQAELVYAIVLVIGKRSAKGEIELKATAASLPLRRRRNSNSITGWVCVCCFFFFSFDDKY